MYIGKFIGKRKIKQVKEFRSGNDEENSQITRYFVEFEDDSVEDYSPKMFKASLSDESVDLTTLRDKQMEPLVKEMIGVLLDWDIKLGDYQYALSLLITSLEEWTKNAVDKLWGKKEREVKLSQLDQVLRK